MSDRPTRPPPRRHSSSPLLTASPEPISKLLQDAARELDRGDPPYEVLARLRLVAHNQGGEAMKRALGAVSRTYHYLMKYRHDQIVAAVHDGEDETPLVVSAQELHSELTVAGYQITRQELLDLCNALGIVLAGSTEEG